MKRFEPGYYESLLCTLHNYVNGTSFAYAGKKPSM